MINRMITADAVKAILGGNPPSKMACAGLNLACAGATALPEEYMSVQASVDGRARGLNLMCNPGLTSLPREIHVCGDLNIAGCSALRGVPTVITVTGKVIVGGNPEGFVARLAAKFPDLEIVGGPVILTDAAILAAVEAANLRLDGRAHADVAEAALRGLVGYDDATDLDIASAVEATAEAWIKDRLGDGDPAPHPLAAPDLAIWAARRLINVEVVAA